MTKLFGALFCICNLFVLTTRYSCAAELESVRIQLRWHHQYQFAGYYAAKHKGFYKAAGFDVELSAGGPNIQPVSEVLSGRADFATANSEVLVEQLQGKPLVALAAIFQHSPSILLTMKSSGITKAEQLKNKSVMLANSNADMIAMFRASGLTEKHINMQKSSYDINDLINGKTFAFTSYLTNEPYYMEERGLKYNIISPIDYGIDFYSDILFTSDERAQQDPESVQRFKEASIKGWQYAIEHSQEIIKIITDEYRPKKSSNHIRFEALAVNSLVKSDLIPVGHMFPERLEKMADIFIEQGMVKNKKLLPKFIFSLPEPINPKTYTWLMIAGVITFISVTIVLSILQMNKRLKEEIAHRKKVEHKLQLLADTDSLTKLLNRRAFIKQYHEQEAASLRYDQPFSLLLLDLDLFKNINDNYGHDVGDKVLVEVAKILTNTLRDVDICARFGGEEFIALLPNTEIDQAKITVERIRENFENTSVLCDDDEIKFTASFGVGEWKHERLSELLISIDKALYRAKENGRNRVEIA